MPKIKKLSIHEAQKIAAGEVVERPANVLKEMLENALDAGATKIAIYIKDGGKQLIRVIDNGCGMSPEDAQLCFEQHATSKITHVEQLQEINTFGFRGEALASIASVSKTTLITKETQATQGTKLILEQGNLVNKESTSANDGTDLAINELFFNLPARKKFLKTRETEWRQIQQLFFALSLAQLHIDFKCYSEDKLVYNCLKTDSITTRLSQLFDHHFAKQMVTLTHANAQLQIQGVISQHQYQRYDRSAIYLFVNNRWVKDSKLTRAVIKGYQNVLPPARYPAACLFITIDPALVDINIHPRKEEVQFLHPRKMETALQRAVTKTLEEQLSNQLNKKITIKQEPYTQPYKQSFAQQNKQSFTPFNFDAFMQPNQPTTYASLDKQPFSSLTTIAATQPTKNEPATHSTQSVPSQQLHAMPEAALNYTLIGQYRLTYLLIEQEDGLLLIDQHAAHERVLYEQFVAQHGTIANVQLLFPQMISLSDNEMSRATKHQKLFAQYGIEIEPFGTNQIKLQATPIHLKNVCLEQLIKQALYWIDEYQHLDEQHFAQTMQKKLYADMACKAAVKAGDSMTQETMHKLLANLYKLDNRFSCPHGRPTSWLMHQDEIKKRFKRDYRSSSQ